MSKKRVLATILFIYLFLSFVAFFIPFEAAKIRPELVLEPPGLSHLFGTDQYGRSIFLRVLTGGRIIIPTGLIATVIGLTFGFLMGLVAYFDKKGAKEVLLRLIDIWLSFPGLIIALLAVYYLGNSMFSVVAGVSLILIPRVTRVIYSSVAKIKTKSYIQSARAIGAGNMRVIAHYIVPNLANIIVVEAGIRFIHAISIIATLNFLGLGVQPPTPDWGLMVAEGRQYIFTAPWIVLFPSLAMGGLIITTNLLIDEFGVEENVKLVKGILPNK